MPRTAPSLGSNARNSAAGQLDPHPLPGFRNPLFGLSPKFHSADLHQQKMVWGTTCRGASIATPSSTENTPERHRRRVPDLAPSRLGLSHPRDRSTLPSQPWQDLQPGETSPLDEIAAATLSL